MRGDHFFSFLLSVWLGLLRSAELAPDWLSSEVVLKAGFTRPGSSVIKAIAETSEISGPTAAAVKAALESEEPSWDRRFRSLVRP